MGKGHLFNHSQELSFLLQKIKEHILGLLETGCSLKDQP